MPRSQVLGMPLPSPKKDHVEQAALDQPRNVLEQADIGIMGANP